MTCLLVKPVCAMLTRDTEVLGKMDPYCVVTVGGNRQRTRTAYSAGKTPSWTEDFLFRLTTEDLISIEVYDEDTATADDLVGDARFPVSRLRVQPLYDDWVELEHRGRSAGRVKVSIKFMAEQQPQYPGPSGSPYAPMAFPPMYYPPPPMPMGQFPPMPQYPYPQYPVQMPPGQYQVPVQPPMCPFFNPNIPQQPSPTIPQAPGVYPPVSGYSYPQAPPTYPYRPY